MWSLILAALRVLGALRRHGPPPEPAVVRKWSVVVFIPLIGTALFFLLLVVDVVIYVLLRFVVKVIRAEPTQLSHRCAVHLVFQSAQEQGKEASHHSPPP
jgi:hypothetical protein